MEDIKLHYATDPRRNDPPLADNERLIWSGKSNRREHFLFWIVRAGIPFTIITVTSLAIAYQYGVLDGISVTSGIPAVIAGLSIIALFAIPVFSLRAARVSYYITSTKLIIRVLNKNSYRYVLLQDIEFIKVVPGWSKKYSSLIISAGMVMAPDGEAPLLIRLVGLENSGHVKDILAGRL